MQRITHTVALLCRCHDNGIIEQQQPFNIKEKRRKSNAERWPIQFDSLLRHQPDWAATYKSSGDLMPFLSQSKLIGFTVFGVDDSDRRVSGEAANYWCPTGRSETRRCAEFVLFLLSFRQWTIRTSITAWPTGNRPMEKSGNRRPGWRRLSGSSRKICATLATTWSTSTKKRPPSPARPSSPPVADPFPIRRATSSASTRSLTATTEKSLNATGSTGQVRFRSFYIRLRVSIFPLPSVNVISRRKLVDEGMPRL